MWAQAEIGMINLIIQGGSFALLTYLLVYGLPKAMIKLADDQKEERKAASEAQHGERVSALGIQREERQDFTTTVRELTKVYREEAQAERLACEKHFTTLSEAVARGHEITVSTIRTLGDNLQAHSLRNQQWTELLARTLKDVQGNGGSPGGK